MNDFQKNEWLKHRKNKAKLYDSDALFEEIKKGDIGALSRGITLIESLNEKHQIEAKNLINKSLTHHGNSLRIGISGVPGVGKSTFIENFGLELIEQGKKVAVLAIDPSSSKNHGSILGDKTRMEKLSMNRNAYIRPTAAGSTLGGVARNTREAIYLCELAGFDVIIIETVGVGQSETAVKNMVDFFLLLMLSGAGDELQGIKRGIMEVADLLVITKSDGENIIPAKKAKVNYLNALHLFKSNENNWNCKVETCSSFNPNDVKKIAEICFQFHSIMSENGFLESNRKKQDIDWFKETLNNYVLDDFHSDKEIKSQVSETINQIKMNKISSFLAAELIFNKYKNDKTGI